MNSKPVFFSTEPYSYLAEEMLRGGLFTKGDLDRKFFPDGERYLRVKVPVEGQHIVLLGGTIDDASTMELHDLASGLVEQGAATLSMVLLYFAYATMERAVKPGEVVTAKTRARLLSSIPHAPFGNRIFLFDVHTEQMIHYFEGNIRKVHVSGKSLIEEIARELAAGRPFVLASTDAGRAKSVTSLAKELGVEPAFAYKKRIDGATVESLGVNGPVEGNVVIMYDDMIRTGGSLMQAAKGYLDAGATDIYAIASHGVLPGNSLSKLEDSGLFRKIVVTNSHPRTQVVRSDLLEVRSVATLLRDAISRELRLSTPIYGD